MTVVSASLLLLAQRIRPAVGPRSGSLVIDGGGETTDPERFVALAGGPDSEFVLIPTATERRRRRRRTK